MCLTVVERIYNYMVSWGRGCLLHVFERLLQDLIFIVIIIVIVVVVVVVVVIIGVVTTFPKTDSCQLESHACLKCIVGMSQRVIKVLRGYQTVLTSINACPDNE